jgi:hypothetical protein
MKKFIFFIIVFLPFLISCENKNANTTTRDPNEPLDSKSITPTTYYVSATDGLKLRSGPGLSFDTLNIIPFRDSVQVINEFSDTITLQDIQGKWLKVKWNNLVGFVFSGFLTNNLPEIETDVFPLINRHTGKTDRGYTFSVSYPSVDVENNNADGPWRISKSNCFELSIPSIARGASPSLEMVYDSISSGRNNNIIFERWSFLSDGQLRMIIFYQEDSHFGMMMTSLNKWSGLANLSYKIIKTVEINEAK